MNSPRESDSPRGVWDKIKEDEIFAFEFRKIYILSWTCDYTHLGITMQRERQTRTWKERNKN